MPDLIVYGSLINKEELFDAFCYISEKDTTPIIVNGFKRVFNQESSWRECEENKLAVLNVVRSDDNWFNGLFVHLENESCFFPIDKREVGYKRVKLDPKSIGFVYGISTKLEDEIWIYTGKKQKLRYDISPIPSYLDICLKGAKMWGKEFYNDFLTTTFLSDEKKLMDYELNGGMQG